MRLNKVDLSSEILTAASLINANLSGANLSGANLSNVETDNNTNFQNVKLTSAYPSSIVTDIATMLVTNIRPE